MKKNALIITMAMIFTAYLTTSCKTGMVVSNQKTTTQGNSSQVSSSQVSTVQVAKFASVENLCLLNLNSTLDDVISILGSKPYNVLSSQVDGYTIYTYLYKLVERNVNPGLINQKGGETSGMEVYNEQLHTVFLFFKNNKLESFITSDGQGNSPMLIMLNNNLYRITKDKITSASNEENTNNKVITVTTTDNSDKQDTKSNNSGINIFTKKKKE